MKNVVALALCVALSACGSARSGTYGVDLKGEDSSMSTRSLNEISSKDWNELAECIYEDQSSQDSSSSVQYQEFAKSERAVIWYDAKAQGLFTTSHSRAWDAEITKAAAGGGSVIRAKIATSLFGRDATGFRDSVKRCL
tara:strand:+ start:8076 stop:8492 length:417 start_codon:yes stop_codon:yes gene_type:complete